MATNKPCPYCGTGNTEDALYCEGCGAPLTVASQAQDKPAQQAIPVIKDPWNCVECDRIIENEDRYCKYCGAGQFEEEEEEGEESTTEAEPETMPEKPAEITRKSLILEFYGFFVVAALISWFIAYLMTGANGWYIDTIFNPVLGWVNFQEFAYGWVFPWAFFGLLIQVLTSVSAVILICIPYLVWTMLVFWPFLGVSAYLDSQKSSA